MLYYLATFLMDSFGPARLLQSHAVLIVLALYIGFFAVYWILPKCCKWLPRDRGRAYTLSADAAKGKPTGTGLVFITIFVVISFLLVPLYKSQIMILILTWLTMLTGYLDDRSTDSWGEYLKGALDLVLCLAASLVLYYAAAQQNPSGDVYFWLPFFANSLKVAPWVYIIVSTVLLWLSINTTNCTDGVDGLSSTLVLIALITLGSVFYFIFGHSDISAYLLVPHLVQGASWAVMIFALVGSLMGYLWYNAYPSSVLMGDAGSRALGFFIGVCVMVSGNPFLILVTSTMIFINGGLGLVKIFIMRFFKIKVLTNIRFPLHDHMRHNCNWSPTQVLIKFMILQVLVTIALVGIFFKIR